MTMRHAAGGAGEIDEPEPDEELVEDPVGGPEPYVRADQRDEAGAAAGAIGGTTVAGQVGGFVGALSGGGLESADEEGNETDDRISREQEWPERARQSGDRT